MGTSEQTSKKAKKPEGGSKKPAQTPPPVEAAVGGGRDQARNSKDWIAEVSHELRLPIANIKLLVETLLDGALDEPQTARRMLTRAQMEVDRLQTLVVDLLSVETVSNSRDVHCDWVDLNVLAKSAVETLQKQIYEKGIQLKIEVARNFQVYANPAQLDQVLLNLLENAIKFTASGGLVSIKSDKKPGCFTVSDSGIGMPAHEIPKIFQRFYRIDRAQSRGSTGLGLSIVKHIIDLHGAKITVTSKEGSGSSFALEFPGPQAERAGGRKSV